MGNIKAEIEKQTDREITEIKKTVNDEIDKLEKEFNERQEKFISEKELEFKREGGLRKREILTNKKLELKKEILNRKRKLIEDIFDEAVEKLKNLDKGRYRRLMEKLLKGVISTKNEEVMPAQKEEVFDKSFISSMNKKYGWKLKLGNKTNRIDGGFLLKETDYETVVDWDSIKEFIRQKEEDRVIAELFKEK